MEVLIEFSQWQQAAGRAEQTRLVAQKVLRKFGSTLGGSLESFTTQDVVSYLARPSFSQNTRATYFSHINSFGDWLVKTGRREDNPAAAAPRPRARRMPPRPVSKVLLPTILSRARDDKVRLMILLAAFQGLRVHEIAKVRGEDVDPYEGSLTVEGKGGKVAILPLHDSVSDAMAVAGVPARGFWFPSPSTHRRGLPVLPSAVYKSITAALDDAGVDATPHALRHLFGTSLVRNGVNLRVIQELMRHESLATTQSYLEVNNEEKRAGLNTLQLAA